MDQSNSKRGCRTNNNFTNTLKIEIKVRFFYLFLFFIYFFFIYVRDCRQEQIYSMDRNEWTVQEDGHRQTLEDRGLSDLTGHILSYGV